MRRPPTVSLSTVGMAVIVLVLSGACSDSSTRSAGTTSTTSKEETASSSTPSRAPSAGRPEVGDCLEPLTTALAQAPQLPELIDCDEPHGGEVIAVDDLDGDTYPALDPQLSGLRELVDRCVGTGPDDLGAFGAFAGDNRLESPAVAGERAGTRSAWLVSSLEGALYVPRPGAWLRGERWAACAVVLKNSSTELASYEGSAKGVLVPGKLPPVFGWCRTTGDDQGDFEIVNCTRPHDREQVASFEVKDAVSYPGNDQLSALAGRLCPGLATAATAGAYAGTDTPTHGLSWTFPTETSWERGDRTGRCYITSLQGQSTGTFASGAPG